MPASLAQRTRCLSIRPVSSSAPGQAISRMSATLGCWKNDLGEISMDIITTPYCCFPIRTICVQKRISTFILSHFAFCAISICYTKRFSAPCTSVLLFSKRDCVFSTKRQPFSFAVAKIHRFFEKSITFPCRHIPPPLPAAPCKKAPLPVGRGAFFFIYRFFFTEQPRQPSEHPRGRCSPTSRQGLRGPCDRRQPACGRWACAGRGHG